MTFILLVLLKVLLFMDDISHSAIIELLKQLNPYSTSNTSKHFKHFNILNIN